MKKSPNVRLTSLMALTAALVAVLAFASAAGARSHRRCSLGAGPLTPTLSFPCNRATVHLGQNLTLRVLDRNATAHRYKPFIELTSKKPGRHGRLPQIPGPGGFFAQLISVKGHPTRFIYRPPIYTFPGWWLITPGRYYVQIQQVDARAGLALKFYSPVSTIYVH